MFIFLDILRLVKGNKIYPFVSINDPQDLKYNGEPTNLVIGDNNKIREYVTINPGTVGGGGKQLLEITAYLWFHPMLLTTVN